MKAALNKFKPTQEECFDLIVKYTKKQQHFGGLGRNQSLPSVVQHYYMKQANEINDVISALASYATPQQTIVKQIPVVTPPPVKQPNPINLATLPADCSYRPPSKSSKHGELGYNQGIMTKK